MWMKPFFEYEFFREQEAFAREDKEDKPGICKATMQDMASFAFKGSKASRRDKEL
ncbi:hypothetical protein SAMN05216316_1247 [Nitrosovibrio sp. Nv6]|nr:hypothetical protein SAMN05216316_1247 [Nitrosovibrio sp. Nv6]